MKYMLLIRQGATPTPLSDGRGFLGGRKGGGLSCLQGDQRDPGVSPGLQLQPPETATHRAGAGRQAPISHQGLAKYIPSLPASRPRLTKRVDPGLIPPRT